ncbi:hypothetical protein ACEPAF_7122 [Sanghuangporus sanghuang]
MMQAEPAPSPPIIDRLKKDTNGENIPSEENVGDRDDRSSESVTDTQPDTGLASTSTTAQTTQTTALPGIRDLFPGE